MEGTIGESMMAGNLLRFEGGEFAPSLEPALEGLERVLKTGDDLVNFLFRDGVRLVQCSSEDDDLYLYRKKAFIKSAATLLESMGWSAPPNAERRIARVCMRA